MDIVFQSGEFYDSGTDWVNVISTIISTIIGAIISGLIAIWIFKRGIQTQKKADKKKENRRLADIKHFYFETIKSNLEPLKNQINYNSILIKRLKAKQASHFIYKFDPSLNFDDLKKIDKRDTFNIFLHSTNVKAEFKSVKYVDLKNSIRLIDIINKESSKTLKYLNEKYQLYQNEFNFKVDKIQKTIQRHTHANDMENIPLELDKFLQEIWKQIIKWEKLENVDNRDPYTLDTHYLQPLRDICADYHLDKRKPDILDLILDAQHYLEQLDGVKRLLREWIVKDTRLLIKAKIRMELSIMEWSE